MNLSCNAFLLIYIASYLHHVQCNNILVLSFVYAKSHNFWDTTLAEELRNEGHNITILQHFPGKNVHNYTVLEVKGFEKYTNLTPDELLDFQFWHIFSYGAFSCEYVLNSPAFKILLEQVNTRVKYHLIVMDLTGGPCLYPLIKLLGSPPVVGTCAFGVIPYIARPFGVHNEEYYIPFYTEQYSTHMNIFQRTYNYLIHGYEYILKIYNWSKYNTLHKKYFRTEIEDLIQYENNFSLLLVNYDLAFDFPRSLPANVIPVGGLHIKEPKPLNKDLQIFLDNSKDGVIVLSFGTVVPLELLKNHTFNILLNALSKLEQNVIIKYNSDINIKLPKNVIKMKFLPQFNILAHHNVKLIINHGGALSTQEAMSLGVPLIAIPFFLDQRSRATIIVEKKIGKKLDINNLSEDWVLSTIQEVLNNPIYKLNCQKLSKLFRDRPLTPLQRAVFWTQHVMRNGGTHLRNPGSDLPFYKKCFLDIWLSIALFVYLFIKILFYIIRACQFQFKKYKIE